jgi:hypothetical protein
VVAPIALQRREMNIAPHIPLSDIIRGVPPFVVMGAPVAG